MTSWTKKGAIKRMEDNALLQELMVHVPEVRAIIQEAVEQRNVEGYHRIRTYARLRDRAAAYVGWGSRGQYREPRHYDAVVLTIADLLPPDDIDLFPDFMIQLSLPIEEVTIQ